MSVAPQTPGATRRTKIVATLGPASRSPAVLRGLIEAGVDVLRLNFSHGDRRTHAESIAAIRDIADGLDRPVGILADLAGPKVRIGEFEGGSATLVAGERFVLTTRPVLGNQAGVSVNYPGLPEDVKPGESILLNDGLIELKVEKVEGPDVHCRVVTGGVLTSHKGVALPMTTLRLPCLTEKDREDLRFGLEQGIDFVGLSFVRRAADVEEARALVAALGYDTPLVAKIERHEALEDLEAILAKADGIMVARGDLAVDTSYERVPMIQKRLIRQANQAGKPVITATQMLRSMVDNPRPTRAEATDIANAVLDGTDAVMLSEESAVGAYPVEAVRVMDRIIRAAEEEIDYSGTLLRRERIGDQGRVIAGAVARAACFIAQDIKAAAILTPTSSGQTARLVARHRPAQPIIALTPDPATYRRLSLSWGVTPLLVGDLLSTDDMIEKAKEAVLRAGILAPGDPLVITAGHPIGVPGGTNLITAVRL
ncbi:MAG TPA: pyruvate kinase [Thermodesulfobacteriota bacterium]|nr:pyruvate kinase [Thermodesulfobacteriota bacterium]